MAATPPPPSGEVEMGGPIGAYGSMASPVKMTSIASGSMDLRDTRVVLSWDDFNELREQQRGMQERIDSLEEERKSRRGSGGEATGLLATIPENSSENRGNPLTESQIESMYDEYKMPESMYTLLTTEKVLSIPFATGIVTGGISLACLGLALSNEIDKKKSGNPFGLPAGVRGVVRAAQYLGVIIGVIMEEEVPQALELIGKGAEQEIARGSRVGSRVRSVRYFSMTRVVFPALFRMVIGYMFLACLFETVVQESTVLDIFFDVLALQFVENLDDILYNVCKRGFFGRSLRVATNKSHTIETSKQSHTFRRRTKRFIRFMYIFNIFGIIGLLTYVTLAQLSGEYRCNLVSVSFGDALWEDAYVTINGVTEPRLLIYSHFNGIYKENGTTTDGRPKYTEQNKEDGAPFKQTKAAEIVYCDDIESWVLRHDDIKTSNSTGEKNKCDWLLRSPETESYDLVDLAEELEWFVWTGLIESDYPVSIECTECDTNTDCNYNGNCMTTGRTSECKCNDEYFGLHCQFERPCKVMRSEKDRAAQLTLLGDPDDDEVDFVEIYGRPIYVMRNMSGKPYSVMRLGYPDDDASYFNVTHAAAVEELVPHKHFDPDYFGDDDFFEVNGKSTGFQELLKEYTFMLFYTGRRWYGKIVPPTTSTESIVEEEYHAFWMNAFSGLGQQDNSTLLISAPSSEGSPVGVDFYEMRRRNIAFEGGKYDYDYSPYGVLLPLIEHEGSGFFHCNRDD